MIVPFFVPEILVSAETVSTVKILTKATFPFFVTLSKTTAMPMPAASTTSDLTTTSATADNMATKTAATLQERQ